MTSLSPSNDYFLSNNMLQKHTHINSFCHWVARNTPYILVDGRVSVCCRDYDGSLVIGSINNETGIDSVINGEEFNTYLLGIESN